MIHSFKDLKVWQKSFNLVEEIYSLTDKLPETEKFGLTSQIRRSSVSIPSNIAEGTLRGTRKDYLNFVRIARASSAELETQILLVQSLYNIEVTEILGCFRRCKKC